MRERSPELEAFVTWLPGELHYAASKASYPEKIDRANLGKDDNRSTYGFLGQEWFRFRWAADKGLHYAPNHAISGQLQLAKFAAGLFDMAALSVWLGSEAVPEEKRASTATDAVAEQVSLLPGSLGAFDPSDLLDRTFEDTPFSPAVIRIMDLLRHTGNLPAGSNGLRDVSENVFRVSLGAGILAMRCYEVYAQANLSHDQLMLPSSETVV